MSARSPARPRRRPRLLQPGPVGQVARWFETIVAFAGEKWAVLVQFLGAEVMAVSAVPCWGRAVVLLVSTSPCFCVLCAVFVALRAHNGQKLAFDGALGKYFRGSAVVGSRRESLLCRVPGIRPIYWQC